MKISPIKEQEEVLKLNLAQGFTPARSESSFKNSVPVGIGLQRIGQGFDLKPSGVLRFRLWLVVQQILEM